MQLSWRKIVPGMLPPDPVKAALYDFGSLRTEQFRQISYRTARPLRDGCYDNLLHA